MIQVLLVAAARRRAALLHRPALAGPLVPGRSGRPRRWSLAAIIAGGFDPDVAGLQHAVDESWIPDLGVRYQLGIDGISVFLVVLTARAVGAATLWSAFHPPGPARAPTS